MNSSFPTLRPLLPARSRRAIAARMLALALGAAAFTAPAFAGEVTHLSVSVAARGAPQHVELGVNKSMIVDLPQDVREVIVSQPTIATVSMRSKRRAVVQGMSAGDTNVFFLDASGNQIAVLDVSAVHDSTTLASTIARLVPGSNISVESVDDRVVLSGTAQSTDDVNRALTIAAQFTGDPAKVGNVVTVGGPQQVMLKVTVAEVSRSTVKQLGINLSVALNGGFSTSLISAPSLDAPAVASAGFAAGGLGVSASLKALESRGAIRTLAEPTLTAISGQAASFHAGGEVPILSGIDTNGTKTYTYKNFGVQLDFTPTIKSNGLVNLAIDTNVSEIADGGFDTGAGVIPGFNDRQAKTSVEMPTGATLAIAGLIQDKTRQQINKLPGLGNIPILGALFRSRDFKRDQTELVVLVTPYLAQATTQPVATPVDSFLLPGDAEGIFLGHLQKLYGVGDAGPQPGQFHGTVGFSLE